MSKLIVEVCRISDIQPIVGADRIVLATIKGWNCIIQKDSFTIGDLCVFIPPDAVLPNELIEKEKLTYLKGNRIKTIKLKGVISQGLVLPVNIPSLKKFWGSGIGTALAEGDDMAKELGITKYEPPVQTGGVMIGKSNWEKFRDLSVGLKEGKIDLRRFITKSFALLKSIFTKKRKGNPDFKIYTDLDNIKHYPDVFEEGEEVIITEKIHGTNFRAGTLPIPDSFIGKIIQKIRGQKYEFVYGSHRVQKVPLSNKGYYGEDVYGQIASRYRLKDIIPEDYTIYGEIYGERIQELTYGIKGIDVVFFDVKYKDKYLDWNEFYNFCLERKLPIVPILSIGKFHKESLEYFTEGNTTMFYTDYGRKLMKQIREGCVVKPLKETYDNHCGRKILKSINPEYLLTKKQDKPEEFIDDNQEFAH